MNIDVSRAGSVMHIIRCWEMAVIEKKAGVQCAMYSVQHFLLNVSTYNFHAILCLLQTNIGPNLHLVRPKKPKRRSINSYRMRPSTIEFENTSMSYSKISLTMYDYILREDIYPRTNIVGDTQLMLQAQANMIV